MTAFAACSEEQEGKPLGAPCLSHAECASGLCTIPLPDPFDGGMNDAQAGLPAKRCTEPGL